MPTKIISDFRLKSRDIDSSVITSHINLQPTTVWKMGDCIGQSILKRKENAWILSTNKQECIDLEIQLDFLLKTITPNIQRIISACEKYNLTAEFFSAAYIEEIMPSLYVSKEIIKKISGLNASLDVDLYFLGECH